MTRPPVDRAAVSPGRLSFAGLVTAILLASVNQNALGAALPTITGELHGVGHMGWVVTSYMLTSTISMPIYGRLSDQVGRRRLLLSGVVLFVCGSVVGGLAPTLGWLIAARMIQGLGAGAIIVLAQATVADLVPPRDRAAFLARLNVVFTLSWVVGPLVGGGLTEGPGWRWVFWVNLPVGAVAFYLLGRHLHLPPPQASRGRLDIAGITLLSLATTALVLLTASAGAGYEVAAVLVVALVALVVAAGVAFVLVERKAADPVVPLALFAARDFNLVAVSALLTGALMMSVVSYLPAYLQMVTTVSATQAGLWMVPMMAGLLGTSIVAGRIISRTGRYRVLPAAGLAVVAAGLGLLCVLGAGASLPLIGLGLAVMGAGFGLTMNLLVLIGQNSFTHAMVGTVTSSINFGRQIGSAMGVAVVGGLFSNRLADSLHDRVDSAASVDPRSLTPELVHVLPAAERLSVTTSYADALMPVYGYLVPFALLGAGLMLFLTHRPLGQRPSVVESLPPRLDEL